MMLIFRISTLLFGFLLIAFSQEAISQDLSEQEYVTVNIDLENPLQIQGFLRTPSITNRDSVLSLIQYPDSARNKGIHGDVIVRVLVGIDGANVRHKMIQSSHPLLAEAVEKEIGKFRFENAIMDNGKPCAFWITIPFQFRLTPERQNEINGNN